MLSFMREQQELPCREPVGPENSEQEQDYLTVKSKANNVRRGTYMLAVLFGIGFLCLMLMIKKSTPQKAEADNTKAAEAQIEATLSRLTGIKTEFFNRMDGIVNKFYEFSNIQQIKVDELVKNPFERDIFIGDLTGRDEQKAADEDAVFLRHQQLKQKAKDLHLMSIIRSEQGNCCMINDKILYEGQTIEDFRIEQIGENFVKLAWGQNDPEKVEIILRLTE